MEKADRECGRSQDSHPVLYGLVLKIGQFSGNHVNESTYFLKQSPDDVLHFLVHQIQAIPFLRLYIPYTQVAAPVLQTRQPE